MDRFSQKAQLLSQMDISGAPETTRALVGDLAADGFDAKATICGNVRQQQNFPVGRLRLGAITATGARFHYRGRPFDASTMEGSAGR